MSLSAEIKAPKSTPVSYTHLFVSDVIIFLGLLMTIVTAKGRQEVLREGIVRQFKRIDYRKSPKESEGKEVTTHE